MSRPITKKSIKLLSHLRRDKDSEQFVNVSNAPDEINCTSSSIEVVEGSFTNLLPIGSKKRNKFTPMCSSTPKYEDITDSETETESVLEDHQDDNDITFNYQEDVVNEGKTAEEFFTKLNSFITDSREMAKSKELKRNDLFKKLNKYKRKITKIERAIGDLDRLIYFGRRIPQLLEFPKE